MKVSRRHPNPQSQAAILRGAIPTFFFEKWTKRQEFSAISFPLDAIFPGRGPSSSPLSRLSIRAGTVTPFGIVHHVSVS